MKHPPRIIQSSTHIWRNDITGLRALAVIPVLIYHAFPQFLPGGFFGVDIFFVISGYLISGIIFRSLSVGTFNYIDFYQKRIKRILPNLAVLLAAVLIFGYFFLLSDEYRNLGQHVISSGLFCQNFRLLGEVDYFTEDALRKPLLHLWSLAIEEQFYIIFPLFIALLWNTFRSKRLIGLSILAIVICSMIVSLISHDRNFNFYFPLTRFWEIGAGISLSFAETYGLIRPRQLSKTLRSSLSVVGLIVIVLLFIFYKSHWAHPGWSTAVLVIATVALILASPDALANRKLLGCRPMTFIGLISYSLYLWHWPILCFLFICVPENTSVILKLLALVCSFVVSIILFKCVENPLRHSKEIFRLNTSCVLLVVLFSIIGIGYTVSSENGFPNRPFAKQYQELNQTRLNGEWTAYRRMKKIKLYDVTFGVTSENSWPSILFFGDSHLAQYQKRINLLSHKTGITSGTLALRGFWHDKIYKENEKAIESAFQDPRVKTIVLASKWYMYRGRRGQKNILKFRDIVQKFPDKKVFIILDAPWDEGARINGKVQQGQMDPMKHFNRFDFNKNDFLVPYDQNGEWRRGNQIVENIFAGEDSVTLIKFEDYICHKGLCDTTKYRDDDHLSPVYLEKNAFWLDAVFKKRGTAG